MLALITSIPALTTLGASNFWGAMADITGRYCRITGFCLLGFTFSLFLIPYINSTVYIILLVTLLSFLYGAVRPLLLSQSTLHREKAKARAISSIFIYESLGFFFGGLIFAYIFDPEEAWTERIIFSFCGLLALSAAVILFFKGTDPPILGDKGPIKGYFSSLGQDLKEVYHSRPMLKLCFVALIVSIANFCFFGMYSFFYTEVVGGSTKLMSITLSLSTVTGMAFFPVARKWVDAKGGHVVLMTSILMWIGNYTLLFLNKNPYISSLLFIMPIYPFFLVSTNTLAAQISSANRRGGGLGVLAGVNALSMALGTMGGGIVSDTLGVGFVPLFSAIFSVLAFMVYKAWKIR